MKESLELVSTCIENIGFVYDDLRNSRSLDIMNIIRDIEDDLINLEILLKKGDV